MEAVIHWKKSGMLAVGAFDFIWHMVASKLRSKAHVLRKKRLLFVYFSELNHSAIKGSNIPRFSGEGLTADTPHSNSLPLLSGALVFLKSLVKSCALARCLQTIEDVSFETRRGET